MPENEEKIMTLLNFQVLQTEAILGLEIDSLSQSSTTWRAIDDRRLSLKAIDERVFTKFRDKKCRIYKFAQQKCRIYPFSRQICRIHTFLCQKSLVP